MTDIVTTIADAIWEGFSTEDNVYADREMSVIDTGGHYESFSMNRVAEHVRARIESSHMIVTVEQLAAIEQGDNKMAGVLIKCFGHQGLGDVYESNGDGTWGILATPPETMRDAEDMALARVSAEDMEFKLPALMLWAPPGDPIRQPDSEPLAGVIVEPRAAAMRALESTPDTVAQQ